MAKYAIPKGPIDTQNWKQVFAKKYHEEQERKRMRLEMERDPYSGVPPPHRIFTPPPFYPAPSPSFPGVFGGDYDRFPGGLPPFNPGIGPGSGMGGIGGVGPMPMFPPAGVPPGARFDPFGPTPDINPFGPGKRATQIFSS